MDQDILEKQALSAASAGSSLRGRPAARYILLSCSSGQLSPESRERISLMLNGAVDWKYLLEIADSHGVTPLLAHSFISAGLIKRIPPPYSERLNSTYHQNLYRNVLFNNEVINVLSALRRHDIPAIALKGTVLAEQLYGNPALRSVSDIDILVHAADLSPAHVLLLELGYRQLPQEKKWEHPFHEAPYTKIGKLPFVIELHREVENPELISIPYDTLWERAGELKIQNAAVTVLSPEDNFLYLANNFSKQTEDVLKSLYDIRTLLHKYCGSLDWQYIAASARTWKIETAVYFTLKRSRELFGEAVPEAAVHALKPGALRLAVLNFLVDREYLAFSASKKKLKGETLNLFYSLFMGRVSQMLMVLSRFRGTGRKLAWPRTMFWIGLVFIAAAMRNFTKLFKNRSVSPYV